MREQMKKKLNSKSITPIQEFRSKRLMKEMMRKKESKECHPKID